MATSVVEICNSALSKVGSARISALDEDNEAARVCNERYNPIRLALLRSHPWNFAISRAELAEVTDNPLFGYDYAFALPADCLRVLAIDSDDFRWDVEGRELLTDASTCIIKYIIDLEDVSKFDATFTEALGYALAADISYRLNQSSTHMATLLKQAETKLREARSYDAQEGYPQRVRSNTFLNFRQ